MLSFPCHRFKNVLFEISSTERTGVFDVNAKFMGVSMDKVELIFQVIAHIMRVVLSFSVVI